MRGTHKLRMECVSGCARVAHVLWMECVIACMGGLREVWCVVCWCGEGQALGCLLLQLLVQALQLRVAVDELLLQLALLDLGRVTQVLVLVG